MPPDLSPSAANLKLGNYELLKELAGSGVASAWVARVPGESGLFSILRLHQHIAKKVEVAEEFLREAKLNRNLRHRNIIPLIETGVGDGEVFVVWEYIEGESLATLLGLARADGLPLAVTLRIGLDILEGLSAAHSVKADPIVHGELNPHHVLVGADGIARVGGFGIGRALAKVGTHGVMRPDRLAYGAPERVRAMAAAGSATYVEGPIDLRSDLFSAAVMLWECISKQRLFASKMEAAVIQKVLTASIPTLASLDGITVPEDVNEIIEKALERDLSRRCATAEEFIMSMEGAGPDVIASQEAVAQFVNDLAGKQIAQRRKEIEEGGTAKKISDRPAAPVLRSRHPTVLGVAPPSSARSAALSAGSKPDLRSLFKPAAAKAPAGEASQPGITPAPAPVKEPPVFARPATPEPPAVARPATPEPPAVARPATPAPAPVARAAVSDKDWDIDVDVDVDVAEDEPKPAVAAPPRRGSDPGVVKPPVLAARRGSDPGVVKPPVLAARRGSDPGVVKPPVLAARRGSDPGVVKPPVLAAGGGKAASTDADAGGAEQKAPEPAAADRGSRPGGLPRVPVRSVPKRPPVVIGKGRKPPPVPPRLAPEAPKVAPPPQIPVATAPVKPDAPEDGPAVVAKADAAPSEPPAAAAAGEKQAAAGQKQAAAGMARPESIPPTKILAGTTPVPAGSAHDEGSGPSQSAPSSSTLRGPAAAALEQVQAFSTLGRYEILMPIAKGGMAAVWAARQNGTRGFQKIVAIKTMLPDVSDDPDFETMFLDEARVASRIRHPNVVEILDLGEENDVIYIVMEWVEGETLSSIMRAAKATGGIPVPLIVRIASQICAGLHGAHELRDDQGALVDLVHRDISPVNILVTNTGFVKVADFGVAKSKARQHVTRAGGIIKGKTPYLSPEQLGGESLDRRSDIFSLGVLLYVMTTGLHPFKGETEVKTVENIALKNPVPPREIVPSLSPELEQIVLKALEKEAENRFATAAEMQRALELLAPSLGPPMTNDDVADFVRKTVGEISEKRAAQLRSAIATADSRLSDPFGAAPAEDGAGAAGAAVAGDQGDLAGKASAQAPKKEAEAAGQAGAQPGEAGKPGAEEPSEKPVAVDAQQPREDKPAAGASAGAEAGGGIVHALKTNRKVQAGAAAIAVAAILIIGLNLGGNGQPEAPDGAAQTREATPSDNAAAVRTGQAEPQPPPADTPAAAPAPAPEETSSAAPEESPPAEEPPAPEEPPPVAEAKPAPTATTTSVSTARPTTRPPSTTTRPTKPVPTTKPTTKKYTPKGI